MRVLTVRCDARMAGLVGFDGDVAHGRIETLAQAPLEEAAIVLRTRSQDPPADISVIWRSSPRNTRSGERLVAPYGESLWRRAPWPVRDELFSMGEPPARGTVLLVGNPSHPTTDAVEKTLTQRGIGIRSTVQMTVSDLEGARIAILPETPGAALPADCMVVPAAGRLLIAAAEASTFGLHGGTDFLAGRDAEDLARLAAAALAQWDAFAPMRRLGRLAARRHRASHVYGRLLADLAMEGALAA